MSLILKIDDRIRVRQLQFWNEFTLTLKYDAVASPFSFKYYFDPTNPEHKELSCIGHYHNAYVEYNNERLVTGTILSIAMNAGPRKDLTAIAGYSLPGVLEDCCPPPDTNLQMDGLSLQQIAEQLIKPFGLQMQVSSAVKAEMQSVFETTKMGDTQKIKDYLTELATQKNIIITHTAGGALVFTRANTGGKPVLDFDTSKGSIPGTQISMSFNGQAMHSHITMRKQADADTGDVAEATVRNPYVFPDSVYRPITLSQDSGSDIDTEQAAKNALAAELKNLRYIINTDRWLLEDGKMLKPNCLVSVLAPEVYLYNKTNLFVEEISYTGTNKATTAILTCVLPEVYNNQTPNYLFKGINLH